MHTARDLSGSAPGTLSRDTQATLLLVARLGDKPRLPTLNRREYNTVAAALKEQDLRPGDLFDDGVLERLRVDPRAATAERLRFLISRASALAFAVDSWANAGLWVLSRGDTDYPRRIRRALKADSPPLLFGAGPLELLQKDGVGVVGSRDVDTAGATFAVRVGRLCAAQGLMVISGAARGVDSDAMLAGVDAGGRALGIVAGDLERHALSKAWRPALRDGSVTLVSPFEPSARFTVGYAMERNRYVYTMSRFVCVVASASGEGGTWAGALENLEAGWSPLVVRADDGARAGNAALIKRGAIPLFSSELNDDADLRALYRRAVDHQQARGAGGAEVLQLPLEALSVAPTVTDVRDRDPDALTGPKTNDPDSTLDLSVGATQSADSEEEPFASSVGGNSAVDVFGLVMPYVERATASPRSLDELKVCFPEVLESQLKIWLARAVAEGRIRRAGRPSRYTHLPRS